MKPTRHALLALLLFMFPLGLLAQSVRISQIDSTNLLMDQEVKLYLSVTDNQGQPIEAISAEALQIFESPNLKSWSQPLTITKVKKASNYEEGVQFLLLVDNSGSMYRTLEGSSTTEETDRRMTLAQGAMRSFLNEVTNPKDRVGLVSYNSFYHLHQKPTLDKAQVVEKLQTVKRPQGDEVYTEIYGSLLLASQDYASARGRKAMIILSDGENSPYLQNVKQPHPVWGSKLVGYQEPIRALQMEGISLYVIYFGKEGDKKDAHLTKIAQETGGATFDAHSKQELQMVYQTIMRQILREVQVSYQASMLPAERKFVRVKASLEQQQVRATRFYFAPALFGAGGQGGNLVALVGIPLALLGLWLLSRIKFEKPASKARLDVIGGGQMVSTQILDLNQAQTVIGCSNDAGLTIAGVPGVEANHATIAFDPGKQQYTLIGQGPLMVNNNSVTTKILQSGDVIKVGSVTMVFDGGMTKVQ